MSDAKAPAGAGAHDHGWVISADVGGTFTDVIALGPRGDVVPVKVLSTPPNFASGVMQAATGALEQAGVPSADVSAVLHGTTVATNAILEARGAVTAVVTTKGFRDVLELGRLRRPLLYDILWQKPVPLARRRHRFELDQRIAAGGEVLRPVDRAEVDALAERMGAAGVEAVAVCLINSYAAPEQERLVAQWLRSALPGVYVSASVDISPEMQEFERTSTAVVNSYVGPVVERYLNDLSRNLTSTGIESPFLIMQSSGGLLDAPAVAQRPVQIIESGPAAGVMAVQKLAQAMGLADVVAFDMGGTTAKASLIEDGKAFIANDYEVGGGMNVARSLGRGAGYAIRVPSIDIAEVGAGGGSVIGADAAGVVHVGPESAGSRPGPACYGLGGDRPTLTDANVTLGYLSPDALAGGTVAIFPDLAAKVLEPLAERLDVSVPVAARGAYDIAVSSMTTAVKAVTSERGRDPRDMALVAFGGAGPLYAAALARELGVGTVIVPLHPGLFSSLGLLVADTEQERVAPAGAGDTDPASLEATFEALTADVRAALLVGRGAGAVIQVRRVLDMRYRGQRFELRIAVPDTPMNAETMAEVNRRFHAEHLKTYGRAGTDELLELVNVRVQGIVTTSITIDDAVSAMPAARAPRRRICWFDEEVDTPVVDRAQLTSTPVPGPMVVEDMDATTLVPPGASAHRDERNSIVVRWTDRTGASA